MQRETLTCFYFLLLLLLWWNICLKVYKTALQIDLKDNMTYVTVEYVCVPQNWLLHWSLSTMSKWTPVGFAIVRRNVQIILHLNVNFHFIILVNVIAWCVTSITSARLIESCEGTATLTSVRNDMRAFGESCLSHSVDENSSATSMWDLFLIEAI